MMDSSAKKNRQYSDDMLRHLALEIESGEVFTSEGLETEIFRICFPFLYHPSKQTLNQLLKETPVMFFQNMRELDSWHETGVPRFWSAYFMGESDFLRLLQIRKTISHS